MQCNAIIALYCIELSLYCIAECRLQRNGQCNTIVLQCNTIQVPFLQERSMWSGKIAIRRGRNKSRRYVAEILQFLRKKSYLPLISLISHYIYRLKMGFGILRWLLQRDRTVESPLVWNLIVRSRETKHPLIRVRPNGQSGQRSHFRSLMSKLFSYPFWQPLWSKGWKDKVYFV